MKVKIDLRDRLFQPPLDDHELRIIRREIEQLFLRGQTLLLRLADGCCWPLKMALPSVASRCDRLMAKSVK